jgi:hypothetical protein
VQFYRNTNGKQLVFNCWAIEMTSEWFILHVFYKCLQVTIKLLLHNVFISKSMIGVEQLMCEVCHLWTVLQSKYKNLPTSATCFLFLLFVLFSVAIFVGKYRGRIPLSFLYIRQFAAEGTPFVHKSCDIIILVRQMIVVGNFKFVQYEHTIGGGLKPICQQISL